MISVTLAQFEIAWGRKGRGVVSVAPVEFLGRDSAGRCYL